MLVVNPLLNVDTYKFDHVNQDPGDTVSIHSSVIARKGDKYCTHVLPMYKEVIHDYLCTQITREFIDEAILEAREQGYNFPADVWEYILEKHNGYLPIKIKAVPEGRPVPVGVVLVKVEITDKKLRVSSIVSYIETVLQRGVWKQTTVATVCRSIRDVLLQAAIDTGADISYVNYALHNFGSRGADCTEADILTAIAHASVFSGSDCAQTNRNIKHYYKTSKAYTSSVIASEHSTMAANANAAKRDDYNAAVKMLDRLEYVLDRRDAGDTWLVPVVSIVIDLYDPFRFAREFIGTRLKERVIELGKRGGKVVLRPDSGSVTEVPLEILRILEECFGYTLNDKGYKVLPSYIGVIQGDGINPDSIRDIIACVKDANYCISNIVFGMGGGLTHGGSRDQFSFAQKATARETTNGEMFDLFKDPITDSGKRSLTGEVTTYYAKDRDRVFSDRVSLMDINKNIEELLVTVFENGKLQNEISFDEVRANAIMPLPNA